MKTGFHDVFTSESAFLCIELAMNVIDQLADTDKGFVPDNKHNAEMIFQWVVAHTHARTHARTHAHIHTHTYTHTYTLTN